MKIKYLIYFTGLVCLPISNLIRCAAPQSTPVVNEDVISQYHVAGAHGEEKSLITLTNSSGRNLWISIKSGGQFTIKQDALAGKNIHTRKSEGVILLKDPFVPSGKSITFDKHSFQNLTLRIFETEDDWTSYQNSKLGIIYLPVKLAGLKEITINFTAEQGYTHSDRINFVGFQCGLCLGTIDNEEVVAIADPCGHKLHRKCIDAWISSAVSSTVSTSRQHYCISCQKQIKGYIYCDAITTRSIIQNNENTILNK